jgi:hypothetical protein
MEETLMKDQVPSIPSQGYDLVISSEDAHYLLEHLKGINRYPNTVSRFVKYLEEVMGYEHD